MEKTTKRRAPYASVYLDKMRNQMEAIRAYEEVLALNPESQAAMQALDGLYEKRRDWEQLIAIRVRLAESLPEDEMLAAYKSLADYATRKIRRPDITRTLWEEIQSLDPCLMRLPIYEQTKDFQALQVPPTGWELVEEPSEQVSLLQKAGSVYQDRLKDAGRAAEIWSRLLELEPQNRRAGDSYKKALLELGDWDTLTAFFLNAERGGELVRVLESQVGVQEDEAAKLDLLFRAAAVYLDPLDKADRAVRAFERILQADPSNQQAAASLEPIYTENSDYRKLVGVLEILLSAASDVELRVEYMRRLAALAEQNLRDPMGAFDWNRRVLSEAADHAEARADVLRLGELTSRAWSMTAWSKRFPESTKLRTSFRFSWRWDEFWMRSWAPMTKRSDGTMRPSSSIQTTLAPSMLLSNSTREPGVGMTSLRRWNERSLSRRTMRAGLP